MLWQQVISAREEEERDQDKFEDSEIYNPRQDQNYNAKIDLGTGGYRNHSRVNCG